MASESPPQSDHGLVGCITSLHPDPRFGVEKEASHLGEQLRRISRRPVERLDPL